VSESGSEGGEEKNGTPIPATMRRKRTSRKRERGRERERRGENTRRNS